MLEELTTLSLVASMSNTFGINSWLTRTNILTFPLPKNVMQKKGAFLLLKIEFSPSTNFEKIIASFKVLSWFDTIIHQKIEKVSQKKYFLNNFTSNHPIATQIPDLIKF